MQIFQIIRGFRRDWLNTLVMFISLAIGFASVSLIALFLSRELGTDKFHKDADQIYALKCDDPWFPGKKSYYCKEGSAEYIRNNFSQVEDYCRVNNSGGDFRIMAGNNEFHKPPSILGASENFFSFFSYTLVSGDSKTVLETSDKIVISKELAGKYFGNEDPVGKVITLIHSDKTEEMMVSGIFEKPVRNTQILFDMVRRIGDAGSRCYLKLAATADREFVERLLLEKKDLIPVINTGTHVPYYLGSLGDAYFDVLRGSSVESSRDKRDLWIALVIGCMILGIAVFNYLGILAGRYHRKLKEYYIRRINGSTPGSLTVRYMTENSFIIVASSIAGLLITFDALPLFNNLTDSMISKDFIFQPEQMVILAGLLFLILLITLIFGVYLIRTSLDLHLLKTGQQEKIRTIQIPSFNIFQLAATTALIICASVIIRQMNYIAKKPIGINRDVIEVKIPARYRDKAGVFRDELLKNASIENVSVTVASPMLEHFLLALKYQTGGTEKQYSLAGFSGDENYLSVLGIEITQGSGFSEILSANTDRCLVNQAFADMFPGQDLIGKGVPGMEDKIISGIVRDFNYFSLKSLVEPAFISYDDKGGHLLVRPSENHSQEARDAISGVWGKLIPDYPLNVESIDDRFEWYHRKNTNFIRLIGACSLISLFLSMAGLFAVSYQKALSRTKEIGIRKINGAKIVEILALINKDFLRWILIAFFFAIPCAWYAMNRWLETYAYRTDLKLWIFVLSGLIILGVSLLTVSWQSWRAATRNPVEALRYE